jgi:hypothetical protein
MAATNINYIAARPAKLAARLVELGAQLNNSILFHGTLQNE